MIETGPCFLTPRLLQPDYPLFVFLPGMDGTGQLLRSQTTGLEAGFDVRCLAIPPTDLTSWDELTAQVVELIHQELQDLPGRAVYLCGESFGGCLAMKVALHSPHLFSRIILVNPASSFRRRPLMSWGGAITSRLPEPLYRLASMGLLLWLANLDRVAPGDRQALWQAIQSVPQETSAWRLSLLNEFTISAAQLRQITQPVLLLASAADRLLPSVSEAQDLAEHLPDVQLVVLPDSGHACLLEAEINLYEIMQKWNFLQPALVATSQD
jgi:pimeloyl-ACP methyl ester carboxylesterase